MPHDFDLSDLYMTEEELAAALHRRKRTLRAWRARGFGPPATQIGKDWFYRREKVPPWLDSLERPAST